MKMTINTSVVQLVERWNHNPKVGSSSLPAGTTITLTKDHQVPNKTRNTGYLMYDTLTQNNNIMKGL